VYLKSIIIIIIISREKKALAIEFGTAVYRFAETSSWLQGQGWVKRSVSDNKPNPTAFYIE